MKALVADHTSTGPEKNFYTSTLAPVNHRREIQFRVWDAALMAVLFLEFALVMRLVLAN